MAPDDFSCLSWLLFRVFILFAYDHNHNHSLLPSAL
jgi:hypothetical protein